MLIFMLSASEGGVRRRSVVDDLAAVVAAGDASECGAKRLAVDGGGERGELVAAGHAAPARQDRKQHLTLEMRQVRPEAAREFFRQGVIGMLRVLRRAPDLVHVARRIPGRALLGETGEEVGMFLRDVESIERVEQRKAVALREQKRLPFL